MAKPYRVLDLINAIDVVHSLAEGKPVTTLCRSNSA
jgi:hypothetical protein